MKLRLYGPPYADEFVIFTSAGGHIFGQHTKQRIYQRGIANYGKGKEPKDRRGKAENKRKNQKSHIKRIRTVSADHEVSQPVSYHKKDLRVIYVRTRWQRARKSHFNIYI